MKASEFLEAGIKHEKDRAATYDKPNGERSIPPTVAAFNAITGHSLTDEQGWLFMTLLKAVRSQQGAFKADNYEDGAMYFGLMGEAGYARRASLDVQTERGKNCGSNPQPQLPDGYTKYDMTDGGWVAYRKDSVVVDSYSGGVFRQHTPTGVRIYPSVTMADGSIPAGQSEVMWQEMAEQLYKIDHKSIIKYTPT